MRRREPPRRDVRRRANQQHRKSGRQALAAAHTAGRLHRSRRRAGARHAGCDARLRGAGASRRLDHRRGEHRDWRLRPRAADGGHGAAGLRAAGQTLSLRVECRRPRTGGRVEASAAGKHALPHRIQDLHHAGDDDQREVGAGVVRSAGRQECGASFRGIDHQRSRSAQVRDRNHLRLLGLGGRPLLDVVGDRLADRDCDRRRGLSAVAVRGPRDGPALCERAARTEPARAAGAARCVEPQFPGFHQPEHRALPQRLAKAAGLPATARDGKQWQARRHAGPAGRCGQFAGAVGRARHQRPARLFPDAAPGDRCGAGGVHRGQARFPSTPEAP